MTTAIITIAFAFAIMLAVIAGMAIGVMNGRKAISGSCGGLNNGRCELCSGDGRCRKRKQT